MCAILLLIMFASPPELDINQAVGVVIRMEGEWEVNGASIKNGDRLKGGATIRPKKTSASAEIKVALYDGEPPVKYTHEKTLPKPPNRANEIWKRIAIGFGIIQQKELAIVTSRGTSKSLKSGLVRMNTHGISLQQGKDTQGKCTLVSTRCDKKATTGDIKGIEHQWDSDSPKPIATGQLEPGVYKFEVWSDTHNKGDGVAYVLILPDDKFAAAIKEFEKLQLYLEKWEEDESTIAIEVAFMLTILGDVSKEGLSR